LLSFLLLSLSSVLHFHSFLAWPVDALFAYRVCSKVKYLCPSLRGKWLCCLHLR
jgi:hypothetical protein